VCVCVCVCVVCVCVVCVCVVCVCVVCVCRACVCRVLRVIVRDKTARLWKRTGDKSWEPSHTLTGHNGAVLLPRLDSLSPNITVTHKALDSRFRRSQATMGGWPRAAETRSPGYGTYSPVSSHHS
jgi:hypothetical protein